MQQPTTSLLEFTGAGGPSFCAWPGAGSGFRFKTIHRLPKHQTSLSQVSPQKWPMAVDSWQSSCVANLCAITFSKALPRSPLRVWCKAPALWVSLLRWHAGLHQIQGDRRTVGECLLLVFVYGIGMCTTLANATIFDFLQFIDQSFGRSFKLIFEPVASEIQPGVPI